MLLKIKLPMRFPLSEGPVEACVAGWVLISPPSSAGGLLLLYELFHYHLLLGTEYIVLLHPELCFSEVTTFGKTRSLVGPIYFFYICNSLLFERFHF